MKRIGTHFSKEFETIYGLSGPLIFIKGWLNEILRKYIGNNGENTPDPIK